MKFKIGNYFDEFLCDVMHMDYCHIMLDRPWKYDRYDMHDGRLNQYTLWVNGRKKVFLTLIESLNEVNYTTIQVCGQWETIISFFHSPKEYIDSIFHFAYNIYHISKVYPT